MLYKKTDLFDKRKHSCTFLAFGCLHAPFHDKKAVDLLIKSIEKYKPDIILNLGDFIEGNAGSKFVKTDSEKYSIIKEFEAADAISQRIIEASPESRRIWIQGNHEANLVDKTRVDKRFREICNYIDSPYLPTAKEWLHPVKYGSARRNTVRFGQITAGHGSQIIKYADQAQAIRYAEVNNLWIGAHTHKFKRVTQCETVYGKLPFYYANTGTMGNLYRDYANRFNTDEWGAAIVVGETTLTHSSLNKVHWKAKTKIFSVKSDKVNIDI